MSGSSASIYQFQCYDYYIIIALVNGSMSCYVLGMYQSIVY